MQEAEFEVGGDDVDVGPVVVVSFVSLFEIEAQVEPIGQALISEAEI